MTPAEIAAKLTGAQRRALVEAQPHKGGEVFARAYSVPDWLTKAFRVYGLGDALNNTGLAVREHLMKEGGSE